MVTNEIKLICRKVTFYCHKDEDAFFEWIKKIDCIQNVYGIGNELYLITHSKKTTDQDLRDLIGLFYRYKVDMKQLSQFLNKKNKHWFYDNKKAFWRRRVFGISKKDEKKI